MRKWWRRWWMAPEKKLTLMDLDPDNITIDQIRGVFGLGEFMARLMLETGVRRKDFVKRENGTWYYTG